MTIEEYNSLFDQILEGQITEAPYDNEAYVQYVKLNNARTKRWNRGGVITSEMKAVLCAIDKPQTWVLITEPWCGDSANIAPLFEKMAAENPNIKLEVQLRDSGSEIDNYLTNGGKSVPKLIVRDEIGKDHFNWGPRPKPAQEMVIKQKSSDASANEKYAELLKWYREDNGVTMQNELIDLLKAI